MNNKNDNLIIEATKNAHACIQCGDTNDFMVIFTDLQICGKCTRKNHKKATR